VTTWYLGRLPSRPSSFCDYDEANETGQTDKSDKHLATDCLFPQFLHYSITLLQKMQRVVTQKQWRIYAKWLPWQSLNVRPFYYLNVRLGTIFAKDKP